MSGIFSMSKQRRRRLPLLLLAGVFIVSSLIQLIPSQPVGAIKYSEMTLDQKARSATYYTALQGCVKKNMYGDIRADSDSYGPTQVDWFNGGEGYVLPDGKLECKTIMSKALANDMWDQTGREFLAGIGYSQKDPAEYDWNGSSDGTTRLSKFNAYVKSILGTSKPEDPTAPGTYYMYDKFWDKYCVVKKLGKVDDIKDPQIKERITKGYTEDADWGLLFAKNRYTSIARVDGIKWGYVYKYKEGSDSYQTEMLGYSAYGDDSIPDPRITCSTVIQKLEANAGAYGDYLNKQAVVKFCQNKGYANTPASSSNPPGSYVLTACINGYENKTKLTYCNDTYKDTTLSYGGATVPISREPERKACKVGADMTAEELKNARDEVLSEETKDEGSSSGSTSPTTCAADQGLGWIVCPVLNAAGGLNDAMYKWIEGILLLNPIQVQDDKGPTNLYIGWQRIRDIANVLLVIVFLIVIFSQVTSIGVSNYGIKKLLPRIILVAIAINLSFYIMMITVDVVNLIGKGLYDILIGLAPPVVADEGAAWGTLVASLVTGATAASLGAAAVAILSPGALIFMALPFVLVAVLSLIAALVTLFVRNALAIVLVLTAPIAFAAFLLPNTKPLFDRWRKLIVGVLFLYPTAALLFGGAKFAAYTMASSDQPLAPLIALFVMAAPLGLLPWLAASSGGILGSIGGKLQGLAQKGMALRKITDPLAENKKKAYQSGRRTWYGRRRSEAEINQRAAEGRRNWGQRVAQAEYNRKKDNENAEETTKRDFYQRAEHGTSRRDQRYADTLDSKRTLEKDTASRKEVFDSRYETRANQPNSLEAGIENRMNDAKAETKFQQGVQNRRQKQRVRNGQVNVVSGANLLDQATQTITLDKQTQALEGQITNIARGGAVYQIAEQQVLQNEKVFGKQLDTQADATLKRTILGSPQLQAVVNATAALEADSAGSQARIDTRVEAEKAPGGVVHQAELRKRDNELGLETAKNNTEELFEREKDAGGALEQADLERERSEMTLDTAKNDVKSTLDAQKQQGGALEAEAIEQESSKMVADTASDDAKAFLTGEKVDGGALEVEARNQEAGKMELDIAESGAKTFLEGEKTPGGGLRAQAVAQEGAKMEAEGAGKRTQGSLDAEKTGGGALEAEALNLEESGDIEEQGKDDAKTFVDDERANGRLRQTTIDTEEGTRQAASAENRKKTMLNEETTFGQLTAAEIEKQESEDQLATAENDAKRRMATERQEGGALQVSNLEKEQSEIRLKGAENTTGAQTELQKAPGGVLFDADMERRASGKQLQNEQDANNLFESEASTEVDTARTTMVDPTVRAALQEEQRRSEILGEAKTGAANELSTAFAQAKLDDEAVAAAAGGIEEGGQIRSQARAADTLSSAEATNIANRKKLIDRRGLTAREMVEEYVGTTREGSSEEDERAIMESAIEKNNAGAILSLLGHVAERSPQPLRDGNGRLVFDAAGNVQWPVRNADGSVATDPATGDPLIAPEPPTPDLRQIGIQQAFDESLGRSPVKLKLYGGAAKGAAGAGMLFMDEGELAIEAMRAKRITTQDWFVGMDNDELQLFGSTVTDVHRLDTLPEPLRELNAQQILAGTRDKQIIKDIEPRKYEALDAIYRKLAGLPEGVPGDGIGLESLDTVRARLFPDGTTP